MLGCARFLVGLVLACVLLTPVPVLGMGGDVLLISSYHPGFPTFFQQVDGLKSVLDPQGVSLDVEFMDSKRFHDPKDFDLFLHHLAAKLDRLKPYKVVVTSDDNALQFLLKHRDALFPNTPVVFCGVNNQDRARALDPDPAFTGVIEAVSIKETLETLFELHPEVSTVHAVVDGTPSGQGDLASFVALQKAFPDKRLGAVRLDLLSWGDLAEITRSFGAEEAILLLSAYTDESGKRKSFDEGLQWLLGNTTVPVYHLWEHGLGKGLVGGKVISHFEQGRTAGLITLDILNGRPVSDIDVVEGNAANKYMFDWNVLQRLSVSEDLLPAGAEFVNKPSSMWEEHKSVLVAASVLFTFMGVLVCVLVFHVLKLRRARQAIRESEERFQLAMEATSDGLWDWDLETGYVYLSPGYCTMLGYDPDDLARDYTSWRDLLHPDDVETAEKRCMAHVESGDEFRHEFRMQTKDGAWKWIMGRGKTIAWDENGRALRMVGTHTDIHEMKSIQARLVQAKDAAETANRVKDEFIANISHEVRTPLNGVMGMLQLLADSKLADEQSEQVATAYQSSKSLLRVLNDLLDFSKMEAGRLEVHERPFELESLVDECLDFFRYQTSERGNTLTATIFPGSHGTYSGDAGRIRQVLFNLLGNSAKFTQDGEITVDAYVLAHPEPGRKRLFFSVRDTGIGLKDDNVARVFAPFTQVDGSLTRNYQGTGLGLPIVKKLVELMGGHCSVESELGKGTTINFFVEVGEDSGEHSSADAHDEEREFRSMNILLVEDEKVNRLMATRMLEKAGHTVVGVENGRECLAALSNHKVDVILMDVQMPILDGYETTRILRTDSLFKAFADIPIIGLSAHASKQDRDFAIEVGMDEYISKPFEKEELERILLKFA